MKSIIFICESQRAYDISVMIIRRLNHSTKVQLLIAPEGNQEISNHSNLTCHYIKKKQGIISRLLQTVFIISYLQQNKYNLCISYTSTGRWSWIIRQILTKHNPKIKHILVQWAFIFTESPVAFEKKPFMKFIEKLYCTIFGFTPQIDRRFGAGNFDFISVFSEYWQKYFESINKNTSTIVMGNPEAAELRTKDQTKKEKMIGVITGAGSTQRGEKQQYNVNYIQNIKTELPDFKLLIRPHPKDLFDYETFFKRNKNFVLRKSNHETLTQFLDTVDIIIAERSTVMNSFMAVGGLSICYDPNKRSFGIDKMMLELNLLSRCGELKGLIKSATLPSNILEYVGPRNFYDDIAKFINVKIHNN